MHLFLTCIVQQPHHMDAVYHTKAGCVGFGLTDDVCVDCVCSVGICCVSRVTGGVLFRELSWKIPLDMGLSSVCVSVCVMIEWLLFEFVRETEVVPLDGQNPCKYFVLKILFQLIYS